MPKPRFAPLPSHCLVDESLHIRLEGLSAGDRVTMRLANKAVGDALWAASAAFVAEQEDLDLTRHAPVSGSYAGVDGMGLFWSRELTPRSAWPIAPDVADDPLTATLTAAVNDSPPRLTHRIRRRFTSVDVTSHEVRDDGLVAQLFLPTAEGRRPGVIVLGGSTGGLQWAFEVAGLLASHGFAALALAYFGMEPLPPTLDRIPLGYFEKALRWFQSHPGVSHDQVGVCGVSRGAELALLLAATYGDIKAVVAYVPSGVVWCGVPQIGHSAWSLQGKEVAFASGPSAAEWEAALAEGRARDDLDWYRLALADESAIGAAEIAVEKIQGPLLLLSGEDDRLWPSTQLAERVVRRCREKNFAHASIHVAYPGAGHDLRWPHAVATVTRFTHPVTGEMLDLGGTPQATARARLDAWQRTLAFLKEHLRLGSRA